MSNPYPDSSNNPPHPPSTTYRATRRPSYATVAAGRPNIADNTTATWIEWAQQRSRTDRTDLDEDDMAQTYSHSNEQSPATARRPGSSNAWAVDSARYNSIASTQHDEHSVFFTPSYLKSSRHVQRLRQAHEQHLAELQEYARNNNTAAHTTVPSLSTSPSVANLHKSHSSHRAVVQDIIERLPPPHLDSTRLPPLPSAWSPAEKPTGLDILGPSASEVRFSGVIKQSDEAASVRSDYPIPKEVGIYYFEVTILSRGKDGLIGIGFSTKKAMLSRLPGWETESWAYHGDDGYVFAGNASGKAYGPGFASQDVVGCGVNFRTNSAFFTKNGNFLGTAFHNIRQERLYPSVGMKKPGEHLRVNFGRTPFVFDIDRLVASDRRTVLDSVRSTDVTSLHPPDDESTLIQNLIGQYLAHEGYVETASAFARDVRKRNAGLQASKGVNFDNEEDEEDIHAVRRQKIRRSILDGDIDRALKYTSTYYPRLFEDDRNGDVYFRLRCQKFVEMMRVCPGGGSVQAGDDEAVEEEQERDEQMELDSQLHRETSMSQPDRDLDVDMASSQSLPSKCPPQSSDQLLQAAVEYGQELQGEFGEDRRLHVRKLLEDMFACLAYVDWEASPVGYLFDTTRRASVGEGVNGAILVSLGKPSSAALEKVCAQTEALLEETSGRSAGGGAAALVDVKKDFLEG
ncbi:unnamed protein product [Zymoseptoria tritici ST99CH_1E4]|uniref:Uncharacterized protein n=1 Tax=Zymoseptoria tritici ST99CH_1E4 TaxID=1276532 RepID=A0A2H1GAX5_ZYMTR|nr:unnamed protein product [Zymoseptoria tritici ST99CH_1E4]